MTSIEHDWLSGIEPDPSKHRTLLHGLLRHAFEDQMSGEDKTIITAAYRRLGGRPESIVTIGAQVYAKQKIRRKAERQTASCDTLPSEAG